MIDTAVVAGPRSFPSGWTAARLADVCRVVSGSTPRSGAAEYWNGDIIWVTPADLGKLDGGRIVNSARRITLAGYESSSTEIAPSGSVVLSSRAPIGHVAVAGVPVCTNQGCKTLVPGPSIDSKFLYYAIRRAVPNIQALGTGATFPEVSKSQIENFLIAFPPLIEQHRIVAILDEAAELQRLRREADRRTAELVPAIFDEMFGDPATNPKGWPAGTIAQLGKVSTGGTPSRANSAYYGDAIEWIKPDNLGAEGYYPTVATVKLSNEGKKIGRIVPAGSTLVTCIAGSKKSIGKASLADREVALNQQINAITPHAGINPAFVFGHVLALKRIMESASTDNMTRLLIKSRFEQLPVILPPLALQAAFSRDFYSVNELVCRQRWCTERLEALSGSLLERAFRGGLG